MSPPDSIRFQVASFHSQVQLDPYYSTVWPFLVLMCVIYSYLWSSDENYVQMSVFKRWQRPRCKRQGADGSSYSTWQPKSVWEASLLRSYGVIYEQVRNNDNALGSTKHTCPVCQGWLNFVISYWLITNDCHDACSERWICIFLSLMYKSSHIVCKLCCSAMRSYYIQLACSYKKKKKKHTIKLISCDEAPLSLHIPPTAAQWPEPGKRLWNWTLWLTLVFSF